MKIEIIFLNNLRRSVVDVDVFNGVHHSHRMSITTYFNFDCIS